jgi:hypothetical protein
MRMKGQRLIRTVVALDSEHKRTDGRCFECGHIPARVWTKRALVCGVCWHRGVVYIRLKYGLDVGKAWA